MQSDVDLPDVRLRNHNNQDCENREEFLELELAGGDQESLRYLEERYLIRETWVELYPALPSMVHLVPSEVCAKE